MTKGRLALRGREGFYPVKRIRGQVAGPERRLGGLARVSDPIVVMARRARATHDRFMLPIDHIPLSGPDLAALARAVGLAVATPAQARALFVGEA